MKLKNILAGLAMAATATPALAGGYVSCEALNNCVELPPVVVEEAPAASLPFSGGGLAPALLGGLALAGVIAAVAAANDSDDASTGTTP